MQLKCPEDGYPLERLECYADEVYICKKCRREYDADYLEDLSFGNEEEDN